MVGVTATKKLNLRVPTGSGSEEGEGRPAEEPNAKAKKAPETSLRSPKDVGRAKGLGCRRKLR